MNRTSCLNELLNFSAPLAATTAKLASQPWDAERALVQLLPSHIVSALSRFLTGEVSASDVEAWANAIESREDIEYSPSSQTGLALHELANPLLTQPLTGRSARSLVGRLSSNAT